MAPVRAADGDLQLGRRGRPAELDRTPPEGVECLHELVVIEPGDPDDRTVGDLDDAAFSDLVGSEPQDLHAHGQSIAEHRHRLARQDAPTGNDRPSDGLDAVDVDLLRDLEALVEFMADVGVERREESIEIAVVQCGVCSSVNLVATLVGVRDTASAVPVSSW
jgi:hypothetical protein